MVVGDYTVVMCAHNEERYIKAALLSVLNQSLKPIEIIVVLDRCTDRTGEIASSFPVKIINKDYSRWNFPYSENLELARKYIDTAYYAIVDADIVLEKDYFKRLIEEFNDKLCCISGEIITYCNNPLCKLIRGFESTYKISINRRPRGGSLLIDNNFLREIGGFKDVPAPDTYVQDMGIKHGYKFKLVRGVKALHIREIDFRKIVNGQICAGIARYIQGKRLSNVIMHSFFRFRPLMLIGYYYGRYYKFLRENL